MSKKDERYRAAIVGAGSIAALYDSPRDRAVLTHAHAFRRHPKTDLVGICDIDSRASKKAANRWSCAAYSDLDDMLIETRPDIVSVCTPDADHVSTLLKVAKARPKLVICEKPVALDSRGLRQITDAYRKIPVLVNYTYRFTDKIRKIRDGIRAGTYGKVLTASALYTKGLRHNGSHAIDLGRYLFGDVISVHALGKRNDYRKDDPSVSAVLAFRRCPEFHLMIGDAKHAFLMELDIICEKKRFRLVDVGFEITEQSVVRHPIYHAYSVMGPPVSASAGLDRSMLDMVDNAVRHLDRREALICTMGDAISTEAVCASLVKHAPHSYV